MRRPAALAVLLLLLAPACSANAPLSTEASAPAALAPVAPAPVASSAPAPSAVPASATAAANPATASATAAAATAEPAGSATAVPSASAGPAAPIASAGPVPAVKVENIGMHIGGGPNDAPTKEPVRRSVAPHFDDFRRCFALADDPKKGGDFGIDLRIDRDGGKAKVSHPRTTIKGKGFVDCVLQAYAAVDFLKPAGGTTNVSYSLRFTP